MALVLVVGFAGMSRAECPAYPEVEWWQNLSHESTIKLVKRTHKGDWAPYIEKWTDQLESLEDIFERESSVLVTKDKIRLEAELLADYIEKVEQRLAVIQCLAEEGASN